jgi:hypothetical protein
MAEKARGQITITDLNDAKTANMFLSSNQALTQVYSKDGATYVPDFSVSPFLVITPEVYVSGQTGNVVGQCQTQHVWTINGQTPSAFGASVGSASPYALTINTNMVSIQTLHIVCTAQWTDNDTSLVVPLKSDITFSKVVNSGTLAFAQIVGKSVFKNSTDAIVLTGQLIRGGQAAPDTTDVSYVWKKLGTTTFDTIAGATSSSLSILPSEVINIASYKVVITDNDSKSGTAGQVFTSPQFDVTDMSDPYSIRIDASNGTTLVNGSGSTTITAVLLRGGDEITTGTITYAWTAFDRNGTAISLGAAVASAKSIIVDHSLVYKKTTFVCEVTIG